MHVDVTYVFRCTATGCETTDIQFWPQQWLAQSRHLPQPIPPVGWMVLGTALVCPQHRITVTMDGEDVLLETDLPF